MTSFTDSIYQNNAFISSIIHYWHLLKPRVMYLVVFTGVAGILVAPGTIHPLIAIIAALCIALGSGAAGCLNMWYDSDIDLLMERTKNRPLPSGKISRESAFEFGVVLSIMSVFLMAIAVNYLSALLLTISILFYVFIYTIWLKRQTPQNIVIGGAAGAFPPMIGWAAVTNSITFESIILFLIIFMWTPPHFWALSLFRHKEYGAANIPMLPVVRGLQSTKIHILVYTVLLVSVSLLPGMFTKHLYLYELSAILLGTIFLWYVFKIFKLKSNASYKKLFGYSISYLFILFSAIVFCCLW